jgi:hypothetical protein
MNLNRKTKLKEIVNGLIPFVQYFEKLKLFDEIIKFEL